MNVKTMEERVVSPEIKAAIVEGLYKGEKMVDLCERFSIKRSTCAQAQRDDPVFDKNVRDARESRCFDLADSLVTLADEANTMIDVQRLRLKSENLRFVVSKLAPRTFGDNVNVNVGVTLDLSKVLAAAASRVATHIAHQDPTIIDVSPSVAGELTTGFKPVASEIDDLL
jgi:hypothetical protein